MDVQHALLSKIVRNQEMRLAVEAHISNECFTDPRYQRIYGYLLKNWNEHGTSLSEGAVHDAFPAMQWVDESEPTEFFIDAVLRRRRHSILLEGLTKAANYIESTDPEATDEMQKVLAEMLQQTFLQTNRTYDIDITTQRAAIEALLDERMENPGRLRGISTGFKGIDFVTGGLQAENFVVLLGTPKNFKSATALAIALAVHDQGKIPLYIGFEMSNQEQIDRLISLMTGISLTSIINGTLTGTDRRVISKALRRLDAMRSFIFSSDIASAMTVGGIQAKIQQYHPDCVIIDGAYMMQSELPKAEKGSPQALTDISRSLKRLAQSTKLPVLVTTQASLHRSKGGLSISSAMYSQSWGQDCDILLGVERVVQDGRREDDSGPVQVKFKVLESRSGPRKETLLEWDWSEGRVDELDPEQQAQLLSAGPTGHSIDFDEDELQP